MSVYGGSKYIVLLINSGHTSAESSAVFDTELEALNYISSQYATYPDGAPGWYSVTESFYVPSTIIGYPGFDATAPAAPTSPVISSPDGINFVLSWEAPDDGGSPVTQYTINATSTLGTQAGPGYGGDDYTSSTSVPITGGYYSLGMENWVTSLIYGFDWQFTVTATNFLGTGPVSESSEAFVLYGGAPAAPSGVTLSGTTASWTQTYPTGAGIPDSWVVLDSSNAAVATVTCTGSQTSGTCTFSPTDGSTAFYVYATNSSGNSPAILSGSQQPVG